VINLPLIRPSRVSSSRSPQQAPREEKAETGNLKAEGIQNSAFPIQKYFGGGQCGIPWWV
jgi:hypothetical protein